MTKYFRAKTGEYREYTPIFQTMLIAKYAKSTFDFIASLGVLFEVQNIGVLRKKTYTNSHSVRHVCYKNNSIVYVIPMSL